MRKILLSIILCACAVMLKAAETVPPKQPVTGMKYLYRLYLTDKQGTPFSLDNPTAFLSKKAVERRRRQGLAVDSTDLPVSPRYLNDLAARGIKVQCVSKWNNTVVVSAFSKTSLDSLSALPYVSAVKCVWTAPDSIEAPRRTASQSSIANWTATDAGLYGAAEVQINMLNGKRLHQAGYRGHGMTIAILDGGFMNVDRIPAFKDIKILGSRDFVVPASSDIFAEIDHGSKVLSCMGMNQPDVFVGTAPDAAFWLLRTEAVPWESLSEEDFWAAGAEFADSVGVDVINSSLGFQDFDDTSTDHTYRELDGHTALISRTASMLASKGIVHVNSAGNDGMSRWKKVNFPADASDILAVGAVAADRINAAFSSVGPTEDGRVKPDVMALGSPAAVVSGRGTINNDMGTSFAAPILTGMVTCLWQARHDLTALQIMDIVRRSASQYDSPNNILGYGIPDFAKALKLPAQ